MHNPSGHEEPAADADLMNNFPASSNTSFLQSIGRASEASLVDRVLERIRTAVAVPALHKLLDIFSAGYHEYARTGLTPDASYLAMRQLFTATNGVFNNLISDAISAGAPPASTSMDRSVFGNSVSEVLADLNSKGYCVFKESLPDEEVEHLVKYAKTRPSHGRAGGGKTEVVAKYDQMRQHGNTLFQFDENELVNDHDIWRICKRTEFADLARDYLKCEPILDLVTMWWSLAVPTTDHEKSAAAQLYHFDLDRLSFLKFFVYLTDVTPLNGPHCYISGSHRGVNDNRLRRDGRFSDHDIKACYPTQEVQILGPKGTIFVADTKGMHKGMPLLEGERLIFQIEFANSLFGAPYTRWNQISVGSMEAEAKTLFAKLSLTT